MVQVLGTTGWHSIPELTSHVRHTPRTGVNPIAFVSLLAPPPYLLRTYCAGYKVGIHWPWESRTGRWGTDKRTKRARALFRVSGKIRLYFIIKDRVLCMVSPWELLYLRRFYVRHSSDDASTPSVRHFRHELLVREQHPTAQCNHWTNIVRKTLDAELRVLFLVPHLIIYKMYVTKEGMINRRRQESALCMWRPWVHPCSRAQRVYRAGELAGNLALAKKEQDKR